MLITFVMSTSPFPRDPVHLHLSRVGALPLFGVQLDRIQEDVTERVELNHLRQPELSEEFPFGVAKVSPVQVQTSTLLSMLKIFSN